MGLILFLVKSKQTNKQKQTFLSSSTTRVLKIGGINLDYLISLPVLSALISGQQHY
jgi:hypothetical protein